MRHEEYDRSLQKNKSRYASSLSILTIICFGSLFRKKVHVYVQARHQFCSFSNIMVCLALFCSYMILSPFESFLFSFFPLTFHHDACGAATGFGCASNVFADDVASVVVVAPLAERGAGVASVLVPDGAAGIAEGGLL